MRKLEPLHDLLVVRELDPATTHRGIVIPGNVNRDEMFGEVLAVGPGVWDHGERREPLSSPGDHIVFTGAYLISLDGEKYRILHDTDVLARVVGMRDT
jgi:chaperonin GroES